MKVATFKAALGVETRKIFNNWPLRPEEKQSVAACLESLRKYTVPKRNVKLARYEFLQCKQQPPDGVNDGETVAQFINRARALVKDCNWGELEEEMLRDIIVAGLRDTRLKKSFIDKPELTAAQVIEQCMSEEATKAELDKNKWFEEEHSVNKVFSREYKQKQCAFCGKAYHRKLQECPARGSTCFYCHQRNHFEAMCKKKQEESALNRRGSKPKRAGKKVATIGETDSGDSGESSAEVCEENIDIIEFLYSIQQNRAGLLKTKLALGDAGRQTDCILDTGATCNVVGLPSLLDILNTKSVKLDSHRAVLKGFGGSAITTLGRATVDVRHAGKQYKAVFNVVKFDQQPILSLYTCKKQTDKTVFLGGGRTRNGCEEHSGPIS